ncbi:MAG: cation diffusion facilitator CzcD-associated flavoprotein CzcO [Limisphaerales bacterium]|jgi:cation diffusion facilitator CzcD-associated flavoprotein CzcO
MIPNKTRVAILGAGMSGLCMAMQLRKQGIDDFVVLEKADNVGGTWRENRYPNIACDVPSHVYSFSFELNPNWSHSYSGGAEILAYCESCVEKHGLSDFIHYNQEVKSANFVDGQWLIETNDGESLQADFVVSGLGGLHLPNRLSVDGLDAFNGRHFHTAMWDEDYDLAGKRVALVGTGASAAQALPGIAPAAKEVTVFQRNAAWVFPRLSAEISDERRALFNKRPWLMRLYRWMIWLQMDLMGILSLKRDGLLSKGLRKAALDHLAESVEDPAVREKLTPKYAAGCKRRVISDDYLTMFNRDNVSLVNDGIERIEANGIRDTQGNLHEIDVLIEATGFKPFDITQYVEIKGRDGQRLQDAWRNRIDSFRTMMVPGFPNFFMMLGPNSATGHTSALIMIESTVNYVIKCMKFAEDRDIAHLDPDPQVVQKYNARLQRDMKKMVFSGGCDSWYTDDDDVNFTLWPYSATRFLFEQNRVVPADFKTS